MAFRVDSYTGLDEIKDRPNQLRDDFTPTRNELIARLVLLAVAGITLGALMSA